jgi:hypothetical protein
MGEKSLKADKTQTDLLVSVPNSIMDDLKKIALFNGVSLEDLGYSYIVDGIASDSRIIKRVEFKRHANETLNTDDFHSKSSKEIINDFNLVY